MFGGQHLHPDPKTGLGLYGPYTMSGGSDPPVRTITVGIVGPPAMVADGERWLSACRNPLRNSGTEPFLYPHFPGMNADFPYQCQIQSGDAWRETIKQSAFATALGRSNFLERVRAVVDLYVSAIGILSERDPRPNIILCCIPQDVIDVCTTRKTRAGENVRRRLTPTERSALKAHRVGQGFLFPDLDPSLGIEDQQPGHHDLRRGLKAEAMQFGIPTQLVWPHTLTLTDVTTAPGGKRTQDAATRAWNFTTALYHKAGAAPWRLADVDPRVCFVGISFYKEVNGEAPGLRTSMAQAFTASGDGYVLRGSSFLWDQEKQGAAPHLDSKSAATLMRGVLELYQRQNRGSLPSRIVVHKSSRYWDDELAGFREACEVVPQVDLVALGWRGIQFFRPGMYPPLRGTYIRFTESDLLLYTVGYVPYLRTYPGARIPQPLDVLEHHGDSPWDLVLRELLGLTKMNWNTADFACSEPITLAFARRVGQILAELPAHVAPRPEYRFYM